MDKQLVAAELVKVAKLLTSDEKTAAWENLPKGWTQESLEKFWKSMTGTVKHKVTKCIKKLEGKMDNPAAFCASCADKIEGTTEWRGKDR